MPAAEAIHPAPLLGRETDLARLDQAYEEARRGDRPVVAIIGEAGIGKTRLVGELVTTLSSRSVRVLVGRAHETESDLPFGLWIPTFREGGALADVVELVSRAPWPRAELSRLFPELAEPGAAPNVNSRPRRIVRSDGAGGGGAGARSELLLVLEDLHWADEPSLRLLAFLVRRLTGGRLAVVLSARVEEMPGAPVLRQVLEELDREAAGAHAVAGPVGPGSLRWRWCGRWLAPGRIRTQLARLSEDVLRVSEGNPFMIVETMRALQEGGRPGPAADCPAATGARHDLRAAGPADGSKPEPRRRGGGDRAAVRFRRWFRRAPGSMRPRPPLRWRSWSGAGSCTSSESAWTSPTTGSGERSTSGCCRPCAPSCTHRSRVRSKPSTPTGSTR